MKIEKIIILTVSLVSKSIFAQDIPDSTRIKQYMADYERLNVLCRGGYPDDPNTGAACKKRESTTQILQKSGWCHIGDWVKCKPKHQLRNRSSDIIPPIKPLFTLKEGQHLQKQSCFMLAGMMSSVPIWRDNRVPISKSYKNVEGALFEIGVPSEGWNKWHEAVIAIYNSPHITSNEVQAKLRPQCERMPGSVY